MTDEEQKKVFSRNLKNLIVKAGKQQQDVAHDLGIKKTTFNSWCRGIILPRMGRVQQIADYFGVSKSDLVDEKPHKEAVRIPVYGRVAAGIPISAITDIEDYEEIPEEMANLGEYMALKIQGDSMEPRIYNGDVVIVQVQDDADSGDIVVVSIGNTDAVCKKLQKTESGIMLLSLNQKYEPMFFSNEEIEKLPVRLYGKVVELRGKF